MARKRFGQHFLHDPAVIDRILVAIGPRPDEHLVEIGPGRGALTGGLLAAAGRLDVVEIDRDLADALRREHAQEPRLRVHTADALAFDFAALAAPPARIRVVGNLPYNVSTPLLFHLAAQRAAIRDMHFMLQREVVERMAAGPGSPAYGRLGVMLQIDFAVQRLFLVGPGAFAPPPRVESAVVRLVPHPSPPVPVGDRGRFATIVARLFSARRKTVRNALRGLLEPDAIRACGIDPGLRPERLGLAEIAALSERLGGASAAPEEA